MPEVNGVTLNATGVNVKAPDKVAVSQILRSTDGEVARTTTVQKVAPKGGMNHMCGVDYVADGRLGVARYVHDEDVHDAADQETTTGKRVKKTHWKKYAVSDFFVGGKPPEAE